MNVLLALALLAPAQAPKEPPKSDAKPAAVAGFGLDAASEFYWPTYLLLSPDVAKELKVTKEQAKLIEGVQAELKKVAAEVGGLAPAAARKHVAAMTAWADKSLAGVLDPEQRVRHRQILWQVLEFTGGVRAMTNNPAFAKEVGLSADQQRKARKIEADFQAAWLKLVRTNPAGGNGPVPGEEALAKKANEDATKMLTAEQKKKWNELLGEPFKGDVVQFTIPGLRPVKFQAPEKK
jgi:hypothetical protein